MPKECRFCQKLVFMSSYQNLRPIFTAARKHIFGKMITLAGCLWGELSCTLRLWCSLDVEFIVHVVTQIK